MPEARDDVHAECQPPLRVVARLGPTFARRAADAAPGEQSAQFVERAALSAIPSHISSRLHARRQSTVRPQSVTTRSGLRAHP